jgi:hypothetical protein
MSAFWIDYQHQSRARIAARERTGKVCACGQSIVGRATRCPDCIDDFATGNQRRARQRAWRLKHKERLRQHRREACA